MAYYQLCNSFENAPGNVCYFCKVPKLPDDPKPILDPGVEIEFEGIPKICGNCVIEWGKMLGMMLPSDAAQLKGKLLQAEAARAKAEKIAEQAQKALFSVQDFVGVMPAPAPPAGPKVVT